MLKIPRQINEQELLDDPSLSFEVRKSLLLELDHVNEKQGIYRNFITHFFKWLEESFPKQKSISILEIGGGSGGLAREILRSCNGKIEIDYHVIDIDKDVLSWAQKIQSELGFKFKTHLSNSNHLEQFKDEQFDVVISLQMIHHLHPYSTVVDFFKQVRRVSKLGFWMVDLERRRFQKLIHFIGNRILTKTSPELSSDGLKSLRRAYTKEELMAAFGMHTSYSMKTRRLLAAPFVILSGKKTIRPV